MKKNTLFFVCLLMLVMVVSCKKENGDKYFLNARMSNFQTSKAYIDNDKYSCFRSGEEIRVNNQTCTVAPNSQDGNRTCGIANVTESQNGYYAFYPAGLLSGTPDISSSSDFANATVSLPQTQNFVYDNTLNRQVINNPMAGHLSGSSGTIPLHNLCALLKITVKATTSATISSIDVTLKGTTIWGTGTVNSSNWELVMDGTQPVSGDHSTVTLSFGQNGRQGNPNGETYYIVVPKTTVDVDNTNSIQVKINGLNLDNSLSQQKTYKIALGNSDDRVVAKNTIRTLPNVSVGYILSYNQNCVFTVNAQSKKVTFAQRRLIRVGSNSTYTVIGYSYGGIGANDRHFFKTTNFANYQINSYPLGTWRTLTQAEWDYIINSRGGDRFAKAVVDNHKGLILFPDGWTTSNSSAVTNKLSTINSKTSNYIYDNPHNISGTEWQTFENEGCVFLRALDYSDSPQGDIGAYSYSTNSQNYGKDPGAQNSGDGYYATNSNTICLKFSNGDIETSFSKSSGRGVIVRLVHDLN